MVSEPTFSEEILSGGVFESQVGESTVGTSAQPQPPTLVQRWKLGGVRSAKAPRPPIQYIVPGLLSYPSVNMVFGPPGSKKSMLMIDLCAALLSGTKWLPNVGKGGVEFDTDLAELDKENGTISYRGGVLWVDGDNGQRRTEERIRAFISRRHVPDDAPLYYESMPDPDLDLSNGRSVQALTDLLRHLCVKLLILDNLSVFSGEVDESSSQMKGVMKNLRHIATDAECAVIIVHHPTKGKGGDREGDWIRGHGSIEGTLDLALYVDCDGQNDPVNVKATKVRGHLKASHFGADLRYTHQPGTSDLEAAYFVAYKPESKQDKERRMVKELAMQLSNGDEEATAKIVKIKLAVMDISMSLDKVKGYMMGY